MQDTIVEPKNKREEWQFPRITQLFYPRQIKKTQDRMNWIEAMMLDRRLKDRPKLVLTRLALHFNLPTGRCDPSLRTLVRGVSMPGSE
ncbi:MAG: hypothetical protein ACXU8R_13260, partial [Xanthobacteraceae bacterium]